MMMKAPRQGGKNRGQTMKKFSAIALGFVATPALAHPGAHLHPHGSETALALFAGLAVIASAGAMAWLLRR